MPSWFALQRRAARQTSRRTAGGGIGRHSGDLTLATCGHTLVNGRGDGDGDSQGSELGVDVVVRDVRLLHRVGLM